MMTRALLKAEIDALPDEYLSVLYKIVRAFVQPPEDISDVVKVSRSVEESEWQAFVQATYGCLAATPIARGDQGTYEVREVM